MKIRIRKEGEPRLTDPCVMFSGREGDMYRDMSIAFWRSGKGGMVRIQSGPAIMYKALPMDDIKHLVEWFAKIWPEMFEVEP